MWSHLYLSIPPRMGPDEINIFLATFGEVSKVYLESENASLFMFYMNKYKI